MNEEICLDTPKLYYLACVRYSGLVYSAYGKTPGKRNGLDYVVCLLPYCLAYPVEPLSRPDNQGKLLALLGYL